MDPITLHFNSENKLFIFVFDRLIYLENDTYDPYKYILCALFHTPIESKMDDLD